MGACWPAARGNTFQQLSRSLGGDSGEKNTRVLVRIVKGCSAQSESAAVAGYRADVVLLCVGEGWRLGSEVLLESPFRYLQLPLVSPQLGWTTLALHYHCLSVGVNR